jgi:hypothetical protein
MQNIGIASYNVLSYGTVFHAVGSCSAQRGGKGQWFINSFFIHIQMIHSGFHMGPCEVEMVKKLFRDIVVIEIQQSK